MLLITSKCYSCNYFSHPVQCAHSKAPKHIRQSPPANSALLLHWGLKLDSNLKTNYPNLLSAKKFIGYTFLICFWSYLTKPLTKSLNPT